MQYTPLMEGWTFFLWGQEPRPVQLPHDFSISGPRRPDAPAGADGGYFPEGWGWYRRMLPPLPERAWLWLDGTQGICEVYLNDCLAAFHPCSYTGFAVDLTPFARKEEENRLEIRVSTLGQPASRWYTGGGLCREVGLYTGGPVVFAPLGLYARTLEATEERAVLSVEASVLARESGGAQWTLRLVDSAGHEAACLRQTATLRAGENRLQGELTVERPLRWRPERPALYTLRAGLEAEGERDEALLTVGLRTVRADPQRGLLLNGDPVKLRGGCLHHDQGPLGACAYPDAERRRIRRLKEAGFEAVRTAHNPPSSAFLRACDELGLLVVLEIFDAWHMGKKPMDGHLFFEAYGQQTVRETLLRDRNHPCVLLWSDGNEIPEKALPGRGYDTEERLIAWIHALDDRPVTQGICCFDFEQEEGANPVTRQDALLDVLGYNYAHERIADDRRRHPGRLMLLTETLPRKALPSWRAVKENPCAAGDFVWTAWDYIGEAGIGHSVYDAATTRGLMPWPWYLAHCGDFDLCGVRRPQSYLREIAWGLRQDPYLTSEDPANFDRPLAISPWGFPPVRPDWSWHGQEGRMTRVRVYAAGDEVTLYLNGSEVGRKMPDDTGETVFSLPYIPGILLAVSYCLGRETGRMALHTTGAPVVLAAEMVEQGEQLIFWNLALLDAAGHLVQGEDRNVTAAVSGGELIALANGDPAPTAGENGLIHPTFQGRLLAVLRRAGPEPAVLKARAEGIAGELICEG